MAKASKREYVWLQCTETGDLNYRVSVNVSGRRSEAPVEEVLVRGCGSRTVHKIKRK